MYVKVRYVELDTPLRAKCDMRPRRHHVATLYASCFQEQTSYHPQKKKLIHSNNLLGLVRRLDIICSFSSSSSEVKKADTSKVLSVAIVGGGPSGFYTAKYLKSEVEKLNNKHEEYQRRLHIDIIEKMPIPFGLVRYGVGKSTDFRFDQYFLSFN